MLKILYATDGSSGALGAARFLSHLPGQEEVHLHLLTVSTPQRNDTGDKGDKAEEDAEKILSASRAALADFSGKITAQVRHAENATGEIVKAIVEEAQQNQADLIAIGICGRSAIARFFLGSVADGVAHKAPCPVLLARPVIGDAFDRVVVGFDGSPDACAAAEWLPNLPLSAESWARLVCVTLPAPVFTGGAGILLMASGVDVDRFADDEREQMVAGARGMVAQLKERGLASQISMEIVEDRDAAGGLVEAARSWESDLIIVGSQGIHATENVLLGSVAHHVLRNAPCSVLIVRSS